MKTTYLVLALVLLIGLVACDSGSSRSGLNYHKNNTIVNKEIKYYESV